ncbi:hypothetical protein EYF80_004898 [Liparis tanakae]|uniref:Uncharacterized protein n=1 Tax=Liparis tanakae TaxID=230148 RepID=A0A4Z2J5P9_9TELE|nr:hypothetical protein EYF80_004898 [Liparis tanakae]
MKSDGPFAWTAINPSELGDRTREAAFRLQQQGVGSAVRGLKKHRSNLSSALCDHNVNSGKSHPRLDVSPRLSSLLFTSFSLWSFKLAAGRNRPLFSEDDTLHTCPAPLGRPTKFNKAEHLAADHPDTSSRGVGEDQRKSKKENANVAPQRDICKLSRRRTRSSSRHQQPEVKGNPEVALLLCRRRRRAH